MADLISDRVMLWKAAWESREADKVAALYTNEATHESSMVPQLYPGKTILKGREEVREYARRGLARFKDLRFEITVVTESPTRAAVEYLRHSDVDAGTPRRVLELIEWDSGLIRAVRVYHF